MSTQNKPYLKRHYGRFYESNGNAAKESVNRIEEKWNVRDVMMCGRGGSGV